MTDPRMPPKNSANIYIQPIFIDNLSVLRIILKSMMAGLQTPPENWRPQAKHMNMDSEKSTQKRTMDLAYDEDSALALIKLRLKQPKSIVPQNQKKKMMKMLNFSLTTLGKKKCICCNTLLNNLSNTTQQIQSTYHQDIVKSLIIIFVRHHSIQSILMKIFQIGCLCLLLHTIVSDTIVQPDLSSMPPDQQSYRLMIIKQNSDMIDRHNSQNKQFVLEKYLQFIDKTSDQISALYLMKSRNANGQEIKFNPKLLKRQPPSSNSIIASLTAASQINVNWTAQGKVSPAKNQGACGSCYIYSSVSDIESSLKFYGVNSDLSEQQAIDCAVPPYGNGCYGGWPTNIFVYYMINGITTESSYPTKSQTVSSGVAGTCSYSRTNYFSIKGYSYTSMYIYDCSGFVNMLMKRPIVVAVAVQPAIFSYYRSGILNSGCGANINHAMHAIGVVQNANQNFYIVKNSWGSWWGENGNVNIDRNLDYGNYCQICYAPSYSII